MGLILLAGCGGSGGSATRSPSATPTPIAPSTKTPTPSPTSSPTPTPSPSPLPSPSPTPSPSPSPPPPPCEPQPYAFDRVAGRAPSYGKRSLRPFPAQGFVCSSYWLDRLADNFVPQSLVVTGTTAFIGGFQWAPAYADRPCQIVVLDLTTGRETGFQERFEAPVYRPAPTFCRHGGGMQLDQSGLWVQETERLWLLDPDQVGHSDAGAPVRRVWRLGKGLRGSTMVRYGDLIGVASFKPGHRGRVSWFKVSDVLAPGVDDLVFTGGDTTDARPVAVGRVPRQLQGVAARGGEVWFSTSGNGCAKLIGPGGKVGFVPGAEGMQFVGNDLWVVSESSSRPYNGGRDLVPLLFRLDAPALIASGVGCR